MKTKIVLPYAPILVESTRSIGYSFESAVADIIDNSLGKEATEVNILFSSKDPQYVESLIMVQVCLGKNLNPQCAMEVKVR